MTLVGKNGTGKTHLACAIVPHLIRNGYRVLYKQAKGIIRDIRATWVTDSAETEAAVVGRLSNVDLLIVDEVGASLGGDAEKVQLFEVLDARYREMRPTILITNLNSSGIKQSLGASAHDRIFDSSNSIVQFDWESYRTAATSQAAAQVGV